jgi:hypothetical protein
MQHQLNRLPAQPEGDPAPLSKIDSALDLLLTLRGSLEIPAEMEHALRRDTVSVSIKFSHQLDAPELQSMSQLGVDFQKLPDGAIAQTGSIYGADVPWDKVDDLAEVPSVIRIESTFQPGVEAPGH